MAGDLLWTDQTKAGPRPVRRYITGHDPSTGQSIYLDVPELMYSPVPGFGEASRSFATTQLPASLEGDSDLKAYLSKDTTASAARGEIIIPAGDSVWCPETALGGVNVVNLSIDPGAVGHMHRTISLDISTCIEGEVIHELDSGQRILLKSGDHVIQRATMHRWINASDTARARISAVLLPCSTFQVQGKFLQEEHRF
ncbi:unnamed protein product [Clonostachys rosea]|uniref:Cupin 2 conserved barrel domain-containing protein n=1 Tax=Bionectria ochroleuca TaxID=29856 RepID=A0ABY6U790_BIOOC|nr:unnamed protein product [Clonostachys rosea]